MGFMQRIGVTLFALALSCAIAPSADRAGFETASVRSSHVGDPGSENSRRESIEHSPLSLTMRNVSLRTCILWAYSIGEYQLTAPAWLVEERYDILAKAGSPSSIPQLQSMLQSLLAERFALKLHSESADRAVYELVVAQPKPGLRQSTSTGDSEMRIADGSFIFKRTTMAQFVKRLEDLRRLIDHPVFDGTNLPGAWDFTLKFAETDIDMRTAMVQGDSLSIFRLLPEQLGLKLENRRRPIAVLVVDHADRTPTAN
jgi:uncharacterized protein (TIGR03435 family)